MNPSYTTLKNRSDFIALRHGAKGVRSSLIVQMKTQSQESKSNSCRIGFTVSKKVGNAVTRNRVRRQLREAVRLYAVNLMKPSHDYVVIARHNAVTAKFGDIVSDLLGAIKKVHKQQEQGRPQHGK